MYSILEIIVAVQMYDCICLVVAVPGVFTSELALHWCARYLLAVVRALRGQGG
jgi:hypothetical protein